MTHSNEQTTAHPDLAKGTHVVTKVTRALKSYFNDPFNMMTFKYGMLDSYQETPFVFDFTNLNLTAQELGDVAAVVKSPAGKKLLTEIKKTIKKKTKDIPVSAEMMSKISVKAKMKNYPYAGSPHIFGEGEIALASDIKFKSDDTGLSIVYKGNRRFAYQ